MTIYRTREYKGYGKQNYYWNEYRLDGNKVVKYRCHRFKFFDGRESEWQDDENLVEAWVLTDSDLPGWLHNYL